MKKHNKWFIVFAILMLTDILIMQRLYAIKSISDPQELHEKQYPESILIAEQKHKDHKENIEKLNKKISGLSRKIRGIDIDVRYRLNLVPLADSEDNIACMLSEITSMINEIKGFDCKFEGIPRVLARQDLAFVGEQVIEIKSQGECLANSIQKYKKLRDPSENADFVAFYKNCELCEDKELIQAYNTIAQELGIAFHDIPPLFFMRPGYPTSPSCIAFYNIKIKSIALRRDLAHSNSKCELNSFLIFTLVHELEHFRQFNKYEGSYHGSNSAHQETGADAAAAGCFECFTCLKLLSFGHYGKVLPKMGYFGSADFDPYCLRAWEADRFVCDKCMDLMVRGIASSFLLGAIIGKALEKLSLKRL